LPLGSPQKGTGHDGIAEIHARALDPVLMVAGQQIIEPQPDALGSSVAALRQAGDAVCSAAWSM
jgi:hypothetical protein